MQADSLTFLVRGNERRGGSKDLVMISSTYLRAHSTRAVNRILRLGGKRSIQQLSHELLTKLRLLVHIRGEA